MIPALRYYSFYWSIKITYKSKTAFSAWYINKYYLPQSKPFINISHEYSITVLEIQTERKN